MQGILPYMFLEAEFLTICSAKLDDCARLGYPDDMSTPVDKIISEALQLPAQARAFVAEKLIDSLDAEPGDELSPAWREEVSKRCRQIDEGLVELRDAEDVFAKAYAALG
jgi:hypothetical protein